jgi:spore germination cell wall hydrolase CwlJ-like protein
MESRNISDWNWRNFFIGLAIPLVIGIYGGVKINQFKRNYNENILTNIIYAEAANQPKEARELVAETIINRVYSPDYPHSLRGVIYQNGAFGSIGSENWKKASNRRKRNDHEEKAYQQCRREAIDVIHGKKLGIPREDEITAFYSGSKPKGKYWESLEVVANKGKMYFCAKKKDDSKKK